MDTIKWSICAILLLPYYYSNATIKRFVSLLNRGDLSKPVFMFVSIEFNDPDKENQSVVEGFDFYWLQNKAKQNNILRFLKIILQWPQFIGLIQYSLASSFVTE